MIQEMLRECSEYNPPDFILEAHKDAVDEIEGNQYAPITVITSSEKDSQKMTFQTHRVWHASRRPYLQCTLLSTVER